MKDEQKELYSALAAAVENFDIPLVEKLLADGYSANELISGHMPIIQLAVDVEADSWAQSGHSDRGDLPPSGRFVELFLKAGADPYVIDPKTGWDAFDAALGPFEDQPCHPGALEMLAKHGYQRRNRPEIEKTGRYRPIQARPEA